MRYYANDDRNFDGAPSARRCAGAPAPPAGAGSLSEMAGGVRWFPRADPVSDQWSECLWLAAGIPRTTDRGASARRRIVPLGADHAGASRGREDAALLQRR